MKTQLCFVALVMGFGCGAEDGGGSDEVQGYVDDLPEWPEPDPERDDRTELGEEARLLDVDPGPALDEIEFTCRRVQHDIMKHHDEILNLGGSETSLKPGILLQGAPFAEGILYTIPIRRSPITLSIDLPVDVSSAVVESPTTATIQQAVADLQVQAGEVSGDLPALVSFTRSEVNSIEQLSYAVGAHGSYDGLITSVSFEAAFAHQESERKITVVAKLLQPMYTISFADDEIAQAASFFAPDVTPEEIADQEALGNIGPDNLPVFISSVTYGRMVVFTATSSVAESSSDIYFALEASVGAFQGGGELDVSTREFLSSLQIEVLALGGNSSDVTGAIVSGDYSRLFSNPDASSAVPLTYVVKNLAGPRPTARLGDVRQFVTEECTPVVAQGWVRVPGPDGIELADVAANEDGVAYAIGTDGVYRFDDHRFVRDFASGDQLHDISVDDDGYAFALDATNYAWKRNLDGTWDRGFGEIVAMDAIGAGYLAGLSLISRVWDEDRDDWDGWRERNGDPYFSSISLASDTLAWCLSEGFGTPSGRAFTFNTTTGAWGEKSPVVLEHLSAASEAEVWALDTSFEIVKWNEASASWQAFPDHAVPVPPQAPVGIEATPSDRLWIVTGAGEVYRYLP